MEVKKLKQNELINMCKERGIKGYSGKNKKELIELINPWENKIKSIADCNGDTVLKSRKYKNMKTLFASKIKSIISVYSKMEKSYEKDYILEWLKQNHYNNRELRGFFSSRTAAISSKIQFDIIRQDCLNSEDLLSNNNKKIILPEYTIKFVKDLYNIQPSSCGQFMEFIMKRIIRELQGVKFEDEASLAVLIMLRDNEKTIDECAEKNRYKQLLVEKYKAEQDWQEAREKYKKHSKYKGYPYLQDLEIDRNKKYEIFAKLEDECFILDDVLEKTFNYKLINTEKCEANNLPLCFEESYEKTVNTKKYKTSDVILEIYNTFQGRNYFFGRIPDPEKYGKFYNKLVETHEIEKILIEPLTKLCSELIKNKNKDNVYLNPKLNIDNLRYAEADIVIDDTLYEIKCTSSDKSDIREINQLLGYSSLMRLDKNYNIKINIISVINILKGFSKSYNIEFMGEADCVKFINKLSYEQV